MAGQKIPSSAQWSDTVGSAIAVARGVIILDADGDYAIDETTYTPDGYLSTDADDDLSIDVIPPGTLVVALAATEIIAY